MGINAFDYKLMGDDAWEKRVLSATDGVGVDLVFDAVTLNGYFSRGMSVLARGGKYICYGMTNSNNPGVLSSLPEFLGILLFRVHMQNYLWTCCDGGRTATFFLGIQEGKYAAHERLVTAVLELIANKSWDPFIGRVWEFEQAKEALQSIGTGTHQGKQIVHIADSE